MSNSVDYFVTAFGYEGVKQLLTQQEPSQLMTGLYYTVFLLHTLGQHNFTHAKVTFLTFFTQI